MILAPTMHILPLTSILRERTLPISGRVVVRLDQKVSAMDVVAEAKMGTQHSLLDVAQLLGISTQKADQLIQCKVGDHLTARQVIAQGSGLVAQLVKCPQDGKVVAMGGGQVLIEVGDPIFELHAGIPGVVSRVIPDRGVEITANGTLIQGVWGNDQVGMGLLVPIPQVNSASDLLEASHLDMSMRGAILMAGHCSDPKTLLAAGEMSLKGLILGSLSAELLPLAFKAAFPIIVTDGFGNHSMNTLAYKLLSTNFKRDITINSCPFNQYSGNRPEIFIPLPVSQPPPMTRETDLFSSGQQVRLRHNPNIFEVGIITDLLAGYTEFPSGLKLPAAEVHLESGQNVTIPLVNLEVLG